MKISYFYIITVLIIGFGFGILINPHPAFAQTISSQDAAIMNAQLELMKETLLEIQKQVALKNALDSLHLTMETIQIKIRNNEISPESAKAIGEIIAGIKINLEAISYNMKPKTVATVKKKITQTVPVPQVQKIISSEQKPETIPETQPLTASIESTLPKSSGTWKIILEIIGLTALIGLGYFAWDKKDYLLALIKLHKTARI